MKSSCSKCQDNIQKSNMSETLATPRRCVVCNSDSKNLVAEPDIEKIRGILHFARRLVDLGEVILRPLSEFLSCLPQFELENVTYHLDCRKKIINKVRLERAKKETALSVIHQPSHRRETGQSNHARQDVHRDLRALFRRRCYACLRDLLVNANITKKNSTRLCLTIVAKHC